MFSPRQMVVVTKKLPKQVCCAVPKIGTKGMVVLSDGYTPYDPPKDTVAVRFKSVDLGYLPSERRFQVQFIPFNALELVD